MPSFLKKLFTRKKNKPIINKNTFNTFVPTETNKKIESVKESISKLKNAKSIAMNREANLKTRASQLEDKLVDLRARIEQSRKNKNRMQVNSGRKLRNMTLKSKALASTQLRQIERMRKKLNIELERKERELLALHPKPVEDWNSGIFQFAPTSSEPTALVEENFDPFPTQEQWNWSVFNKKPTTANINLINSTNLLNLAHQKPAQINIQFPENVPSTTRRVIGRYPRYK